MTRPLHGGPPEESHGSPYAEPVHSPYAGPAQLPYAEHPPSPYAYPPSPYAEPVRRPDYLRPRRRVEIPVAPPRRWPWMVTATVSAVVIAIAVAVMVKNLNEPDQVRFKAGRTRPSATVSPPTIPATSRSAPTTAPTDEDDPDQSSDSSSTEEDTVEITPEAPPATTKAKPKTVAPTEEPEDGEAQIPKVRGRNAEDVQEQLRDLGFTNIQLVPDDPASGIVLFAAGWKAVSVDPSPGEIADVTDAVIVRCVPLSN